MGVLQRIFAMRGAWGTALLWAACAWASISYTARLDGIAAVWPANAVLLACLLSRETRSWWGPALCTLLFAIAENLLMGRAIPVAFCYPFANVGEALLAAAVLRPLGRGSALFERTGATITFVVACVVAGGASSCLAALVVYGQVGHFVPVKWLNWFAANTLGLLILTPFLLIAAETAAKGRRRTLWGSGGRFPVLDALVALTPVTLIAGMVFLAPPVPSMFLVFPPVLYAVHRLRAFGAAAATIIVAVIAAWGTAKGVGSIAIIQDDPASHLLFLQFYLAVLFLTALPTAALLAQRDRLAEAARAGETRLREAAQAATRDAERLAATDELTGLPNRRAFMRRLEEELVRARGYRMPLALAIFDIDHFKEVNDRHGHGCGDLVLHAVAQGARAAVRAEDMVARLGGEEFGVLMPGATAGHARPLAERLRAAVESLRSAGGVAVTVSVGLATLTEDMSADALLAAADRALYAAKHDGRNRLRIAA